ncbi:MAG: hypothetical protein V1904_14535, partial [Bacteroidota bacterium]
TGIFLIFLLGNAFTQTVITASTSTQSNATAEQKTASAIEEMTKIAALTSEQIEKVTPFVTEFFKQKEIDQADNKGNAELLKVAATKRREILINNLNTVLSAEQMELLKQHWEKLTSKGVGTETQTKE